MDTPIFESYDYTTFPLNVNGKPVQVMSESTSPEVINGYNTFSNIIVAFFNRFKDANGNPIAPPTDGAGNRLLSAPGAPLPVNIPGSNTPFISWVDAIVTAASALESLAQNGITLPDGITKSYITYGMGASIDQVLKSLNAAGFVFNPPSILGTPPTDLTNPQNQALMRWSDLSSFGLQDIIKQASVQGNSAVSLQWMLQVNYVKTANDIITKTLSQLKEAVNINQAILQTLSEVQDLHNSVQVMNKSLTADQTTLLNNFTTGTNIPNTVQTYTAAYKTLTTTLFGNPITPIPIVNVTPTVGGNPTPLGNNAASQVVFDKFVELKQKLSNEIAELQALNLSTQSSGKEAAGSLLTNLQKVLADMSPLDAAGNRLPDSNVLGQVMKWLIDGQGVDPSTQTTSAIAGQYQQNLVNATNMASSFNDTQKQNLNTQLFLLQQFYQSAAALLSSLNSMITKVAGGISGR